MENNFYTLLVYSENVAGVLNEITGIFTRRQVNIESLNVSASSIDGIHKYTITCWSDADQILKIKKQIEKKISVIKADFYTDDQLFIHEVALYKISTPTLLDNPEISRAIRQHNARMMEVNPTYATVLFTGLTEEIGDLYSKLNSFNCLLQYTRSGRIAVTRSFENLSPNTSLSMENNELLPKVGAYKFQIQPFHCDFSNRLFPGHLGNGMLNAADYHSSDRGYGVAELNLNRKTWVLSRFAIEILEMPKAYDKVEVQTWVESAKKFFTSRNYAVVSRDGTKPYAYGRSIWAMIDIDTRQPTDISTVHGGLIEKYVETGKECPMDPPARVVIGKDLELAREINVYYNDIDINGHLNSVKYIDHVLDLFDIDYYRTHQLRRVDIAYVAEAHLGDVVRIYKAQVAEGEYVVKMTKKAEKEVEIVRCMIKFVKD